MAKYGRCTVGKYTSPMDAMGMVFDNLHITGITTFQDISNRRTNGLKGPP